MFNFINDMGNYEDRCVGRNDYPWGMVSTARVSDGKRPYETAVAHTDYCDEGLMVIEEAYDTKPDAVAGHARWVKKMTAKKLPNKLVDCSNSGVQSMLDAFSDKDECTFKRKSA